MRIAKYSIYNNFFIGVYITGVFAQKVDVKNAFKHAAAQTALMLQEIEKATDPAKPELISPRTLENGKLKLVATRDWTSGFFPGVLWYLDEYYGTDEWKSAARKFTTYMEKEKTNGTTHDMGFKVFL